MADAFLGGSGFAIAVYLISIMIAVSGISLGIGYALNERRFKEFGRSELYQAVVNGAIVGGMMALFANGGIVSGVISSATLANGTALNCSEGLASNPAICLAYDYLAGTQNYTFMGVAHRSVLTMSTSTLTSLIALDAVLGTIASLRISVAVFSFSFSYVMAPIISEIQYLVKLLSTVTIGTLVQASVLVFVSVGTLSLILPAGLVLRSFYPTRKLGGFLIALSIGLYAVLPLSYVFNMMLVNSYLSDSQTAQISQVTLSASGMESSFLSLGSESNSSAGSGIGSKVSGMLSSFSAGVSTMIEEVLSSVSYFIVYVFILPAFSLVVTGISVKEFAELLGSEAPIGALKMLG